jgi:hypothetical protein
MIGERHVPGELDMADETLAAHRTKSLLVETCMCTLGYQ